MSVDNDMKIVLQASLDTSSKGIKGLKNDIKTLKDSLKEERLGLNAKLNTDGQAVKRIKDDIGELAKKVAEKKLALNCTINLSGDSKKEINNKINSLSDSKSINPLKLRVQLNIDKNTISTINKQIDTLAKSLNNLSLKANVSVDDDVKINKGSADKDNISDTSDLNDKLSKTDSNKANEESLKNQNKLLKEVKKTTGDIVTETKTYQNSLTEVEQITTSGKQGQEQKLQTIEKISDYQKVSNTLYQRQAQIEQEILKWKDLKKNASEEELETINQAIQSLEAEKQANDEILNDANLYNQKLDEKMQKQREMSQILANQKEMLREMKIGEDTGYEDKNLFGNQEAIEEWAKSVHGSSVSISNYQTKIKSLNDQQSQFVVATKSSRGMVTEYTYAVDKATGKVFKLGERVREAGRRTIDWANDFKIAIARLTEWNLAMVLVQGGMKKFQEGIEFIKELDNQLTQVAMVTGQTRQEVQALTQEYVNMANETSKTVSEIARVNTELTRQGLGELESTERLETILKLSSVASMDVNNTLSIITSSVNALGESAEHTADVLVKAGNISASSVESIGTAMTKVASSAKSNGMAIEELTGITATLIDVTQEAPETLGNSLKSMMARFSKINELGELNEDLNDVHKAFESVGIAFTDAEGQIRPFYELCSEMAEKWVYLDQNTKAYVATMSAGTMQGNRFIAMMENWNRVSEITNSLQNGADGTLDESYQTWQTGIEASLNRIQIAWESLYTSFFNSETVIMVFDAIALAVRGLGAVFEKLDVAGVAVAVSLTAMMIKGGQVTAIYKSMQSAGGVLKATMLALNTVTKLSTNEEARAIAMKKLHHRIATSLEGKFVALGVTQKYSEVGWKTYSLAVLGATGKTVALGVATTVATGGLTLLAGLLAGSLFGGLSKMSDNVDDATESTKELISASKESISSHQKTIKSLKDVSGKYYEYQKRIESGSEKLKLSAKEQEEYNEIVSKMAEISPSIIDGYDEQGNAIVKYGTTIQGLIEKEEALIEVEKQRILANSNNVTQEIKNEMEKLKEKEKIYKLMMAEGLSEEKATKNHGMYDDTYVDNKYEQKLERIAELKEQLKNTDASKDPEGYSKVNNELKNLESTYTLVLAKMKVMNADLETAKSQMDEIADIKIDTAFDEINLDDSSVGKIGEDLILNVLSDAIETDVDNAEQKLDEAISVFKDLYGEMDNLLQDDSEESINNNSEALRGLADRLTELGVPAQDAIDWIYQIAYAMTDGKQMTDSFALSISGLSEMFNNSMDEIDKLQGYLKKLAKGERLARDEIDELMESYDGIAEYIAESGDLYLENGEKIQEILEEKYSILIDNLSAQQKLAKEEQESLEAQKEKLEDRLRYMKLVFDEDSKVYQQQLQKIEEVNAKIAENNAELGKLSAQQQVYKMYAEEDYNTDNFEAMSEMYEQATEQIAGYNELLKEISENGISGDVIHEVMTNHLELIDVLGDEEAMYARIQDMIKETEQVQKNSYENMFQYSTSYLTSILNANADLFNQLVEMYGTDLSNFQTLYSLKAQLHNTIASAIGGNAEYYAGLETTQDFDNEISKLTKQLETASYQKAQGIEEAIKGLEVAKQLKGQSMITLDESVKGADFKKVNSRGSVGSKKSSSKSTKKNIDLIELETDAYIKLTKAMEELERQQENNQRITEYADGKDRIELLTKEIDMLTKKQKITSNLANEYRAELSKLESELSKTIGLNDGAYGINNYRAYIKKTEDEINALIKQINASTNDTVIDTLTEKKDDLEDKIKQFQEDFERYLEIKTNTIPDLSDSWWEMVYEKFEYTLEIMETDLAKYEKQIERIDSSLGYILQGRNDNTSVLEKEYELMLNMAEIYKEEIANIQDKVDANNKVIEKYEKQLESISDKQSDTYIATSRYLTLARYEQDKLAEAMQSSMDQYASQLNNQIQKHVEMLDDMKEKAIETFEAMRKELDQFSTKEFEVELDTIMASLDKIDGIFMRNPQYTLSTSEARNNLNNLEDDIDDIYSKISSYKTISERISKSTSKDAQSVNKNKEDLLSLIEEQIEYENYLKEIYTEIKEELAETTLHYQKVEDALQAQIDAKEEELEQLQEQFETEDKITSLMEKRLALLKAMDDTRYTYITGQGESVFTYDVSNVNALKQELGQAQREQDRDDMIEAMQNEIDEMNEKLEKTKEIHEQQLAILELQENKLSDMLDILSESLDTNLSDTMDKIYEDLTDVYIEELQTELDTQTGLLREILNAIDNRQTIASSNITQEVDSGSNWATKTTTHTVSKDETLDSIASKYNTSVEKILKLNTNLKKDSVLQYGQSLRVPAQFDTGGYTGDFGSDGKLAVLHEKELVLNKQDTSNVLEAVDIARNIAKGFATSSIGANTLESITNNNTTNEQQQIIQNMNIYGVQDANAFSNEMQKIFRNGMARLS